MTNEDKVPAPPYVAFRTFLNFLDWLQAAGVPTRIDRTFWGGKLSGAYGFQLMSALRFLGLLSDDDRPHPTLETMALDSERRKPILRELLLAHYQSALDGLDLQRATQGELDEGFRRYKLGGETLRKAVAFFVHAAQYAELPLSPHIVRRTKTRRTNGTAKPRRRRAVGKASTLGANESSPAAPPTPPTTDELGAAAGSIGVRWLIQRLPKPGALFPDNDRETWIQAARAVFDMEYKKMEYKKEEEGK